MPKRATLTFSSDDAPAVKSQELHVYYCKYSGKHALTTDCDLRKVRARAASGNEGLNALHFWFLCRHCQQYLFHAET